MQLLWGLRLSRSGFSSHDRRRLLNLRLLHRWHLGVRLHSSQEVVDLGLILDPLLPHVLLNHLVGLCRVELLKSFKIRLRWRRRRVNCLRRLGMHHWLHHRLWSRFLSNFGLRLCLSYLLGGLRSLLQWSFRDRCTLDRLGCCLHRDSSLLLLFVDTNLCVFSIWHSRFCLLGYLLLRFNWLLLGCCAVLLFALNLLWLNLIHGLWLDGLVQGL